MALSLCMIVKDEASALARCLASVKGVVDEMVVLDTGSTDETVAIAQSQGAIVHHFAWTNNFAEARNESLKYATSDWILVLDADETLTEEVVPALQQAIQAESCILVNLVRQEVGAAQSPYSLVSRLFRKHPDIIFSRPYHAMVDDSIAALMMREPHWRVGTLPMPAIRHDGYHPDAIAGRDKLSRAKAAMETYLAAHPDDPYVCSKLGALYTEIGDVEPGIALLQRGLKASSLDPSIAYELHYHLGIAYRQRRDLRQAATHYQAAIQQPILPRLKLGAYNNWGNLLKASGHLDAAKQVYEAVIQIDPTLALGHYNLGLTLKTLGDFSGAIAAYQKALSLNPNYADAYQNLGVVLLKMGQETDGFAALGQAIALHSQQGNLQEVQRLQQGLQDMGFTLEETGIQSD